MRSDNSENIESGVGSEQSSHQSATDKELVRERFAASFGRYDLLATVQKQICVQLAEMLRQNCAGPVGRVLEIGAGTGFLTRELVESFPDSQWYINDLVRDAQPFLERYTDSLCTTFLWGDAERIEFPFGLDLIASASTVQWFDDMVGFAYRAAQSTVSGGYLALSTFGLNNFKQIRATTGEGLEYYTPENLAALFEQAGYEVVDARDYTETLSFADPAEVLHHIKTLGVNSVRRRRLVRRDLAEFDRNYRQLFSSADGGVTLTYHPMMLVARKR